MIYCIVFPQAQQNCSQRRAYETSVQREGEGDKASPRVLSLFPDPISVRVFHYHRHPPSKPKVRVYVVSSLVVFSTFYALMPFLNLFVSSGCFTNNQTCNFHFSTPDSCEYSLRISLFNVWLPFISLVIVKNEDCIYILS